MMAFLLPTITGVVCINVGFFAGHFTGWAACGRHVQQQRQRAATAKGR